MTAATPKPNRSTSKKRKASKADQQAPPPGVEIKKKKSPLFDRPQNYYAPTAISSMTKDELSEWRKDQRRKRNRESAAASRNKTRARIEELEGEVGAWKRMHREMEDKMRCMERHVRFLTQLNASLQVQGGQPERVVAAAPFSPPTSAALVSHPNSPPRSPPPSVSLPAPPSSVSLPAISVPHAVIPGQYAAPVPLDVTSSLPPPTAPSSNHHATHPFPSLLSEPQDCAQVETRIAAAAAILPHDESREHLTPVSRQA